MAETVLSPAALNRAALARQHLLARTTVDPVTVAGQAGGLQAQEPASPFIGLWARTTDLDPGAVLTALHARRLVKATLMRATLHLVPAPAYRQLAPAMTPLIDGALTRATRGSRPGDAELARFRAAVLELAATPRRNSELRELLGPLDPDRDDEAAWWWVRRHVPLVHAPVAGAAWGFDRRPWLVAADSWLAGDAGFAGEADGTVALVRGYLAAFGPATLQDVASWSRLGIGRLRGALAALEAAGEIVHARTETGRPLLDLRDLPRPDPRTPAPPRLLPMWDSLLLAYADRDRVIAREDRARVVDVNGDTYPTFLVDGRVAGLWWARDDHGRTVIDLEPFRPIPARAERALRLEAEALAAFVQPREPAVYARYRGSRDRRLAR